MSFYDSLTKEVLSDLLRAYDSYISNAADAGLLTTGWTPVCVQEFYENEYEEVWDPEKGDESFDYMYDYSESFSMEDHHPNIPVKGEAYDLNGTRIFRQGDELMCQFSDEDTPRPLRSRIQDIREGDGFIVGALVRIADFDAHQNLDEPDEPWIVYDISDESWFEKDIQNAEMFLVASQHGKAGHQEDVLIPVNMVTIIRERPSENEQWVDSFWVDAREVPAVDLFKKAVRDYLETGDGHIAIKNSCEDFNWGDAMMYVPAYHWNVHGIYPVDPNKAAKEMGLTPTPNNNPVIFEVDQDEVLIPDSYYEQKEAHRPLDDIIRDAESKRPGIDAQGKGSISFER